MTLRNPQLSPLRPDRFVSIDGIQLNYTSSLIPSTRNVLVFLHGFAASLETWRDILPLIACHHSVIALDLKGSGFSSKPEDTKYAPNNQADLIIKFLGAIQVRNAVLVGHSLGGGIALLAYLKSRSLSQDTSINGLILIDSAGLSSKLPFFVSAFRNPVMAFVSDLMSPYRRAQFVLKRIMKVKKQITPERISRYANFLDMPGSHFALRQTAKDIVPENFVALQTEYRSITIPTLILWGDEDPVIPVSDSYRFKDEIPFSTLKLLQKTGHIPQEERPRETSDAILEYMKGFQ